MRIAVGALIGGIGGLVFVVANAGGLPSGWAWPVRVAGLVAFLCVLWFAVLRRWSVRSSGPARPEALRTYGWSVLAMVAAIPLGSFVLRKVDHPQLVLPWVVVVVGAHFLPMARGFAAPVFTRLGLILVGVGVLGGLATALSRAESTGHALAFTGTAAGFAILACSASGSRLAGAAPAHGAIAGSSSAATD